MGRLTAAVLVLATGLSLAVAPSTGQTVQAAPDSAAVRNDIDGYISQAMDEWKIPGLAIAVITLLILLLELMNRDGREAAAPIPKEESEVLYTFADSHVLLVISVLRFTSHYP